MRSVACFLRLACANIRASADQAHAGRASQKEPTVLLFDYYFIGQWDPKSDHFLDSFQNTPVIRKNNVFIKTRRTRQQVENNTPTVKF